MKIIFNRMLPMVIILFFSFENVDAEPSGHWLGILQIKSIAYRVYLKHSAGSSQLFLLMPKANEIPLDTIFFRNDSVYFKRGDYYSTFSGNYKAKSNIIDGLWTDYNRKKYRITFTPVNPDTLTGLHPKTEKFYTWRNPVQTNDGLTTGSLSEQNIDKKLLEALSDQIIHETYPNIQSLLVSRNGHLVYEEYFYGFKQQDLWLIQSVTKSFTGALTGIALSKKEIKGLDQPICNFLSEYKEKVCNEQNKSITIRHLLTMTTGLEWNELEFDYYDERNSANQCGKVADPFECVLSRNRVSSGGSSFSYNSMNHLMMNKILRKSVSMRNLKELKKRILKPLNIQQVKVADDRFGVIGDIALTPRDMVKFGLLYLNNGVWNGKHIIPSHWIKESTTSKIQLGPHEGYGYFWWTKQFEIEGKIVDSYYGWGYGGQYIFVVPAKQLVVTMTASNWGVDEKKYAFSMMEKFILPACHEAPPKE